jgi:hypothetical protein
MQFTIADVVLEIEPDDAARHIPCISLFSHLPPTAADIRVVVEAVPYIAHPVGPVVLNDLNKWVPLASDDFSCCVFQSQNDSNKESAEVILRCDVSDFWRQMHVRYLQECTTKIELGNAINQTVMKNRLLFMAGVIVHGAAVKCGEDVILFTAPSGTGKSTQADLWVKERGAVIINDDAPVIRMRNDCPMVYGTPWCGSRNICTNDAGPLRAIIILQQGEANSLRQMHPAEAVAQFLPRCFLPFHDPVLIAKATDIVEEIMKSTDIYLFSCRPDSDAVDTLAKRLGW